MEVAKLGHNPFIPNLYHWVHCNWPDSPSEDYWLNTVKEWLRFCDALFVAEMPPWEGSGVQVEIDMAHCIGIPVFYTLGDLLQTYPEKSCSP